MNELVKSRNMIAEISTGGIVLKLLTDITGGNSHAVDFRMQYQNYCHVFFKEKR